MPGAAFFDVDRTLIVGNTAGLYMKYARRHRARAEPVARRLRDGFLTLYYYAQYKMNRLDMEAVMVRSAATLTGRRADEFRAFCARMVDEMVLPLVYPEVRGIIDRHRAAGEALAIISASLDPLVAPVARALGLDAALATELVAEDGILTGDYRRPPCFGEGKVLYAERFCAERGLSLEESHFYTDSISDLPLLERVGCRHIVNPDFLLGREAVRRGWPIERFGAAGGEATRTASCRVR